MSGIDGPFPRLAICEMPIFISGELAAISPGPFGYRGHSPVK